MIRLAESVVLWCGFTFLLGIAICCLPAVIVWHLCLDQD